MSACFAAFALRSAMSTLPSSSQPIATIRMPAIAADAGLVPWAETGIRQTSRAPSPFDAWYARIERRPAYSPLAPELGCRDMPGKPVISQRMSSRDVMSSAYLWQDRKTNGSGGAVQSNSLVRLGKRGVPLRLVERRERVHPVHLGPPVVGGGEALGRRRSLVERWQ